MNRIAQGLLSASLVLLPPGAPAQPEIKSATYKITKVDRYDVQVVRIAGQWLTVDMEGFGRRRFQLPYDFSFEIDGEKHTLNQLRQGQKLHVYVTRVDSGELMLMQDAESTEGILGEEVKE